MVWNISKILIFGFLEDNGGCTVYSNNNNIYKKKFGIQNILRIWRKIYKYIEKNIFFQIITAIYNLQTQFTDKFFLTLINYFNIKIHSMLFVKIVETANINNNNDSNNEDFKNQNKSMGDILKYAVKKNL